jgi:hypothetical protein
MKKIAFAILVLLTLVMVQACYYDKEDLLYGNAGPCTDSLGTISYSQKIVPLLQQYCYSCHSGSFPSGNILMGSHANDRVIALNGKLYGSVSHATGYSPMPRGMSKLTPCQIALIKKWIDSGIPNN